MSVISKNEFMFGDGPTHPDEAGMNGARQRFVCPTLNWSDDQFRMGHPNF